MHSINKTQRGESPMEPTTNQNRSGGVSPLSFVLGLIAALVIGAIIGYGLGLVQAGQEPALVVVTATPNPQTAAQIVPSPTPLPQDDTAADTKADTADNPPPTPTIMEFLLSDARHFQGSADAPVTIIEFSDFK
jgi:hypothetical protein